MKKILKEKLITLWECLARQATLYLPLEEGGIVNFAPWDEGAHVNLEVNTLVSAKNIVFPQTETYLQFKKDNGNLQMQATTAGGDCIVFGLRPCDVASFAIMEKVFMEDPVDSLYSRRREQSTIISLGCSQPDDTCFCTSFDLEPAYAPGADIMTWDLGEHLFWDAQTDKGKALTRLVEDHMDEANSRETAAVKDLRERVTAREAATVRQRGWTTAGIKEVLKEMFDDDIWDRIYLRCLGCGICTYLCPTCHCFDIQDFSKDQEGQRFRCWDSCMFAEFTLMTSGENPRPTQKERVRQRFLHKLLYFSSKHELYACVGCGRCVNKCPVHLDITQVIREVASKAHY